MKKTPKTIPSKSGVYEIVNTETGMKYIGSSVNLKQREYSHIYALRKGTHYNTYLQNSFNKYGESVFEFNIIELKKRKEIRATEQSVIDSYDFSDLYNVVSGVGTYFPPQKEAVPVVEEHITGVFPVFLEVDSYTPLPLTDKVKMIVDEALMFGWGGDFVPCPQESLERYFIWLSNVIYQTMWCELGPAFVPCLEVVKLRRLKKEEGRVGRSSLSYAVDCGSARNVHFSKAQIEYYLSMAFGYEEPPDVVRDLVERKMFYLPCDDSYRNEVLQMFVNLWEYDSPPPTNRGYIKNLRNLRHRQYSKEDREKMYRLQAGIDEPFDWVGQCLDNGSIYGGDKKIGATN